MVGAGVILSAVAFVAWVLPETLDRSHRAPFEGARALTKLPALYRGLLQRSPALGAVWAMHFASSVGVMTLQTSFVLYAG